MADKQQFDLIGAKKFYSMMDGLPTATKAQVLKSVHRKIAREEIANPLKSHLPYGKTTTKNIKVASAKGEPTGIIVGPNTGSYWLRFLEKGTKPRKSRKGATWRGMTGHSLIEIFYERKIKHVINRINKDYGKLIGEFIAKKLKTSKKT